MRKLLRFAVGFAVGVSFAWVPQAVEVALVWMPQFVPAGLFELSDELTELLMHLLFVVVVGTLAGLSLYVQPQRVGSKIRTRLWTVIAFAVGTVSFIWSAPTLGIRDDDLERRGGLNDYQQMTLRRIVAKGGMGIVRWWPKSANPNNWFESYQVMTIPRTVQEIYLRNPLDTLRFLKIIIEYGPAADAHTAIAYAQAAIGYANDDPVLLIGACHYFYDRADQFDRVRGVGPETHRQFAIKRIDELIAEVEVKQNQKWPTPKKK